MSALPRSTTARVVALGLSALLMAGCQPSQDAATLSTHEVPPARAQAIADAINATLMQNTDEAWLGRAQLAAPGTLVVRAPASLQPSIADAISKLQQVGDDTSMPTQLRVEAWWVTEHVDAPMIPAELEGVAKALGRDPGALRLRDRVEIGVAATGRTASVSGDTLIMKIEALPEGDAFALDLAVAEMAPSVTATGRALQYNGQVLAKPGEFVVLASRPAASGGSDYLVLRIRGE